MSLLQKDGLYESIVALSGMAIVLLDLDGRRIFANDRMVELSGRSREEFLSGCFGDTLLPEDRKRARAAFKRCIETGETIHGFMCRWPVGGKTRHGSSSWSPVRDPGGNIVGVQVTTLDITEMVQAQEALKRSEALYHTLLEAVGAAVIRLDREGHRTFVNDFAAELYHRPKAELLGGRFGDNMVPEDRKGARDLLEKTFRTGKPVFGLVTRRIIDGQERHVMANWVPIRDANGRVTEVQSTTYDVTEYVKLREQEELYSAMLDRAQEEERLRISQFLHDDTIQALLALSHTLQDVLQGQGVVGEAARGQLEQASTVVLDQIEALRRLSLTLRPAVLDRMGLDAAIRWLVRQTCEANGVAGVADIGEGWRRLSPAVEVRLFRIVQEAVNNAVRHGHPRQLRVSMDIKDGCIDLLVEDDGQGFDASRSQVEMLRQGHLGLTGMRERARELGGELTVESQPSQGSRIHLRAPVEQAEHSV